LPGASTPSPGEGDPTTTTTTATKCEELGTLTPGGAEAHFVNSEVRTLTASIAERTVVSKIAVVGVGPATELVGTAASFAGTENANYETCNHCLVISVGGTWFYPRSGTSTFTAVPSTAGESFQGTFTDVTLEEVRLDTSTSRSTPVPAGACFHVNTLTFNAVALSSETTSSSSGGTTSGSSSGGTGSSSGSGSGGGGGDAKASVL
jgi:hypothetical protein